MRLWADLIWGGHPSHGRGPGELLPTQPLYHSTVLQLSWPSLNLLGDHSQHILHVPIGAASASVALRAAERAVGSISTPLQAWGALSGTTSQCCSTGFAVGMGTPGSRRSKMRGTINQMGPRIIRVIRQHRALQNPTCIHVLCRASARNEEDL